MFTAKFKFLVSLILFSSGNILAANDSYYMFKDKIEYTQEVLDLKGVTKDYTLASHFYKYPESKKLMITIHGYADNCGYMKFIHQFLWNKGFSILCIELPGHGLSSGDRATIDSFDTYEKIISLIPKKYFNAYKTVNFLAHSTGTVSLLMHLQAKKKNPFSKTILLSPLVRSKYWYPSTLALPLLKFFTDTIPRSDKSEPKHHMYRDMIKNDPHAITRISLDWFSKLRMWNKKISKYKLKYDDELFVIFSEDDEVIDITYNMKFYKEYFPKADFTLIKNATHHMDYSHSEVQKIFYKKLDQILK